MELRVASIPRLLWPAVVVSRRVAGTARLVTVADPARVTALGASVESYNVVVGRKLLVVGDRWLSVFHTGLVLVVANRGPLIVYGDRLDIGTRVGRRWCRVAWWSVLLVRVATLAVVWLLLVAVTPASLVVTVVGARVTSADGVARTESETILDSSDSVVDAADSSVNSVVDAVETAVDAAVETALDAAAETTGSEKKNFFL